MAADARDATATFPIESETTTARSRLALDVLPTLLEPVTTDGVTVAIAQGAVRHFAYASAIDRIDPVLGLRRVAFAWQQGVAAPVECRSAPTQLPPRWALEAACLLPDDASRILFPPLARAPVISVPLWLDGTLHAHLWLLGRAGIDFDHGALALVSELGRWASSALSRARMMDTIARASERQAELAAAVEHEIKTPLGTLVGWARLLASEPDAQSERARRGLAAIERAGNAMTRVVEDWHQASRTLLGGVALERHAASVVALVRGVVAARRASLKESGTRVTLDAAGDVHACIDEDRVHEMVEHMLDRIERKTPLGGTIAVRVAPHGHAVVVVVESSTATFEREPQDLRAPPMRDPSAVSSASRVSDRTLALAVVRGIAELHGGSAGAELADSTFGERIWALLPVEKADPAPRGPVAATMPPTHADLRGVHVLLVDDARDSLELAAAIVRLRGAHAALASSSSEALDLLRTLPIDVMVSDIAMPVEDGCSLIRRAHELRPNLRAAALSAHVHAEDRERALAAGFDTYLTKPVDPEALALVIRSLAHEVPPTA